MIDKLFNDNFEEYCNIAKRLLYKYHYIYNIETNAMAMVNESYIYLTSITIESNDENKIKSMVVRNMQNQLIWRVGSRGMVRSELQPTTVELLPEFDIDEEESPIDEEEFENKLKFIENKVSKLDDHGKKLFELAIAGPYNTTGKLSKYTKLSGTSCYRMLRDMRNYLRDGY